MNRNGQPTTATRFTSALVGSGFGSAGESFEGHQHRWTNGRGQIDILIPVGVGERGRLRDATGGTSARAKPRHGRTIRPLRTPDSS